MGEACSISKQCKTIREAEGLQNFEDADLRKLSAPSTTTMNRMCPPVVEYKQPTNCPTLSPSPVRDSSLKAWSLLLEVDLDA